MCMFTYQLYSTTILLYYCILYIYHISYTMYPNQYTYHYISREINEIPLNPL